MPENFELVGKFIPHGYLAIIYDEQQKGPEEFIRLTSVDHALADFQYVVNSRDLRLIEKEYERIRAEIARVARLAEVPQPVQPQSAA